MKTKNRESKKVNALTKLSDEQKDNIRYLEKIIIVGDKMTDNKYYETLRKIEKNRESQDDSQESPQGH